MAANLHRRLQRRRQLPEHALLLARGRVEHVDPRADQRVGVQARQVLPEVRLGAPHQRAHGLVHVDDVEIGVGDHHVGVGVVQRHLDPGRLDRLPGDVRRRPQHQNRDQQADQDADAGQDRQRDQTRPLVLLRRDQGLFGELLDLGKQRRQFVVELVGFRLDRFDQALDFQNLAVVDPGEHLIDMLGERRVAAFGSGYHLQHMPELRPGLIGVGLFDRPPGRLLDGGKLFLDLAVQFLELPLRRPEPLSGMAGVHRGKAHHPLEQDGLLQLVRRDRRDRLGDREVVLADLAHLHLDRAQEIDPKTRGHHQYRHVHAKHRDHTRPETRLAKHALHQNHSVTPNSDGLATAPVSFPRFPVSRPVRRLQACRRPQVRSGRTSHPAAEWRPCGRRTWQGP